MILKAKHNFIIYPFFRWYAGFIIKRHNSTLRIIADFDDKKLPILLISNHISWWDGFWAMYINEQVLHRKFHFMMLEEQLRRYRFFNFTGGFSVNKNTKSIIESLNYTAGLLSDSKNMVLLFPQGEIQSQHNQNIEFQSGLERILKNRGDSVQVVFLVNLVDYFSQPKPGIYFHLREYCGGAYDLKSIQAGYRKFYAESVSKQMTFN